MDFEDGAFDVVIDKGLLDTILVRYSNFSAESFPFWILEKPWLKYTEYLIVKESIFVFLMEHLKKESSIWKKYEFLIKFNWKIFPPYKIYKPNMQSENLHFKQE